MADASGFFMKRVIAAVVVGAMLAACATMAGAPRESAMDGQFRAIYEKEWAWRKSLNADDVDEDADEDDAPKTWPRVDPATQAERQAYLTDVIRQLDALDTKAMSPDAQLNLAVYRDQIEVKLSQIKFRQYEKPLNADTTFWTLAASAA